MASITGSFKTLITPVALSGLSMSETRQFAADDSNTLTAEIQPLLTACYSSSSFSASDISTVNGESVFGPLDIVPSDDGTASLTLTNSNPAKSCTVTLWVLEDEVDKKLTDIGKLKTYPRKAKIIDEFTTWLNGLTSSDGMADTATISKSEFKTALSNIH